MTVSPLASPTRPTSPSTSPSVATSAPRPSQRRRRLSPRRQRRLTATVQFTSADGRQAERQFTWDELRIVDAEPSARPITDEIAAAVTRLTAPLELTLDEWESDVRRGGAEPGDTHRHRLAANVLLQRETAALIAANPPWLEGLLGQQPGDVAGATTWTDAASSATSPATDSSTTSTHQTRHRSTPTGRDSGRRVGCPQHRPRPRPSLDRQHRPPRPRVADRAIAQRTPHTAPRTGRPLRHRTRRLPTPSSLACRPAHLDLDDTRELLEAANRQQGERQHWIVRNWPHVVEYQEINRTLATGTWGPDPQLLEAITDPALKAVVEAGQRWTRSALCAVATPRSASSRS